MADEDLDVKGGDEGANDKDAFLDALSEVDVNPEDLLTDAEKEAAASKTDDEDKGKDKQEIGEKERDLQARIDRLEAHNKDLNKALHDKRLERKAAKAAEQSEVTLSDADLAKIIEEHKDDPSALLNTVTYKMQQLLKKGKAEAVDEVAVQQKKTQFDTLLRERYGEALDDDSSEVRKNINKAKEFLGLDEHPYGDALGAAAAVFASLPQIIKAQYERGKKDALDGKVEEHRVEDIKGNKQTPDKKTGNGGEPVDKKTGLTADQMETAQRLGFKPGSPQMKIYLSQIRRANAA